VKITFFHHSLRLGSGIDTVIYELANRLGRKEDVTVYTFVTNYEEKDCNFNIRKINSTFAVDTSKRFKFACSPFFLDKSPGLKQELKKFDLINTHLYPANYIVRNLKNPVNLVVEWSAGQPQMFASLFDRAYYKWLTHANMVAAQKADLVLAPCDFVRKWVTQKYSIPAEYMFLDGINFDLFDRFKISPHRFMELHPSLEGKKILLFVGRITDSKNIHSLIQILDHVKAKIGQVSLVLVGDYAHYPEYYSKLSRLIKTKNLENNVIFAGVVGWNDLPSYYAACDVYVTCSLWEGFLRAEAFAAGKPIVCFDVAANSETVKNQVNGFALNISDHEGFANKLVQLLSDEKLAKQFGKAGYDWAKSNLDFDEISRKFGVLCSREIDKHGKHSELE
jgi:1,2-diacylglycerol 3-alpha-glucosyltransferase